MISSQQQCQLIKQKSDYYKALERNGYRLPSMKHNIITIEFLIGVRMQTIYCPKYDELVLRPCPDPPTQNVVRDELVQTLLRGAQAYPVGQKEKFISLATHLGRTSNRDWMLEVLSTITRGDHQFYRKDYFAERNYQQKAPTFVNNRDDFFTGLPLSRSKKTGSDLRFISKADRDAMKLAKLQEQLARQQEKVTKMNNDLQNQNVRQPFNERQNQDLNQFNQPEEEQKDDGMILDERDSKENQRRKPRNAKVQALANYGLQPNVIRNESL